MARQIRQTLPDPPATYDRDYMAALAKAVNQYMSQMQALGEITAGHFIMTDAIRIPGHVPELAISGGNALCGWCRLFAVNVTAANPAPTSSTTPVMMGLAMTFQTTYTKTGIFTINGQVGNTGNGTTTLNLAYGTGTPPVNGAPFTGALVGQAVAYKGPSSGAYVPFAQTILLNTITTGVPHWIDAVVFVSNGSSIVRDVEFVGQGLRDSNEYYLTTVSETDP